MNTAALVIAFVLFAVPAATAQTPTNETEKKCDSPIVKPGEVDQKAKVLKRIEPKFSEEEMLKHRNGLIIIQAIFCASGEVTNIKVARGLSDSVNNKAIEAVRKTRFKPAEKNGAKVSMPITFEYRLTVSRIL